MADTNHPYTPFFTALPDLLSENRTLLWAKSAGLWIGLAITALIFGNVINIYTAQVPFIGETIENVLGWGGVIWAVLSIVNVIYTLHRLHIQRVLDDAIKRDRRDRTTAAR